MIELSVALLIVLVAAPLLVVALYGLYTIGQQREYIETLQKVRETDKRYMQKLEEAVEVQRRASETYQEILDVQAAMLEQAEKTNVRLLEAVGEIDGGMHQPV